MIARERIRQLIEKWFITEPLFFAAWNTHSLKVEPRIRNIRVGHGRIEYNPEFIDSLNPRLLAEVLRFEVMRILLKHPYSRRKENLYLQYEASNLAIQEALHTELAIPTARERFGTDAYDRQYFEFYYAQLQTEYAQIKDKNITSCETSSYTDPLQSGQENSANWDQDEFITDQIDTVIRDVQANSGWGTITGSAREQILATLKPVLDYRAVLRQFRTSILSLRRSLTRMKPNRRYGFDYMGSRREYATRLLIAVDVSGSMGITELQRGFSIINRFFKYGIAQIDVVQFDTQITAPLLQLKRARHAVMVTGRGGTDFTPVLQYINEHPSYDGVVIFTDGQAPVPKVYKNLRTRILWLFVHENCYRSSYPYLKHLGLGAFLT